MEAQVDPAALQVIARTPEILRQFAPASTGAAADVGAWDVHEVIAHLLDTHDIAFISRIRRIVEEDDPYIQSIDPPARLASGGLLERTADSLIDELAAVRERDLAWVQSLSPEQLARGGTHDVAGTLHAAEIVNYMAFHDLTHLKQASAAVQERLKVRIGNMVQFIEE